MSDVEKMSKDNDWTMAVGRLRRRHWFLTTAREMHELFVKKKIFLRKCFMCPEMLSHGDVAVAYTIPYSSISDEFRGNFTTFCLCKTCVFLAMEDDQSDISRMTQAAAFAQQNDTSGQMQEKKSEIRCLSDELARLSREIANSKNGIAHLSKIKAEKDKEKETVMKQIEASSQEIVMLKKQLEEEKKKTGTDEYKEALAKLREPFESALENFKSFREIVQKMSSDFETLNEEADDVGIQLKILHVCKICMCSKEKWISFDCGHIFCQECAALKNDKCAFCNKQVNSWHEVYLP